MGQEATRGRRRDRRLGLGCFGRRSPGKVRARERQGPTPLQREGRATPGGTEAEKTGAMRWCPGEAVVLAQRGRPGAGRTGWAAGRRGAGGEGENLGIP